MALEFSSNRVYARPVSSDAVQLSERRGRRRWSLPVPLVVALVGAVLSVWILPAFTRQWDDRQKAREVKTQLFADIAATLSSAVASDSPIRGHARAPQSEAARRAWEVAQTTLRFRLRAYAPSVLPRWNRYAQAIDGYLDAEIEAVYVLNVNQGKSFDGSRLEGEPLDVGQFQDALENDVAVVANKHDASAIASNLTAGDEGTRSYGQQQLDDALRVRADAVGDAILGARLNGFSTTRVDLIKDLIPGY